MNKILKAFLIINLLIYNLNAFSLNHSRRHPKDTTLVKIRLKDTSNFVLKCDDPIIYMLDSLSKSKYFETTSQSIQKESKNIYNFPENFVPVYSDSIYDQRIKKLNANSAFKLVYNQDVKAYINVYAVQKRKLTARILGMAKMYFPYFEEKLDKYNMPLELKYLAAVESAINPRAKSPAGAGGIWQFMYGTGIMYNLEETSYVDDRYDPYKATIAACRHMKDLYNMYHDWALVLAAYNSGAGNVNKAIRRAGGIMDFWKIQRYLPKETQAYVPAFIAVVYVMNYAQEHNLYPILPKYLHFEIDTVHIHQQVSFAQISETLKIPYEDIEFLNPTYKKGIIPFNAEKPYSLVLPKNQIGNFINNETAIYNYKTKEEILQEELLAKKIAEQLEKEKELALKHDAILAKRMRKSNASDSSSDIATSESKRSISKSEDVSRKTHIVKKGETLCQIASKYGCTIYNLKEWNSGKSKNIMVGSVLYVSAPVKLKNKNTEKSLTATKSKAEKTNSNAENNLQTNKDDSSENVSDDNSNSGNSQKKENSKHNIKHEKKYVYHTVQKGDTLWSIANQYKSLSIEEIKKLNNISGPADLKPGQKIKVAIAG
ncbi:MAG: LysM peptidoglycan-binding domain-containing protein [Bacteroidota bacterium]|nr:LysM peptidoglycan-binding domain-containing protein [Bacteroidota bacterium]